MNIHPLNLLDAVLVIILGWNFFRGFNKGAIEEILSIAGIGISIFIAVKSAHVVAAKFVSDPDAPIIIMTGFVIYGILFLISKYIAFTLNSLYSKGFLGLLNNLLGFLFGIFRGILLTSIFLLFIGATMPDSYLIKTSYLGGFFAPVTDIVVSLLPEKAKKKVEKNWKTAEAILLKNRKAWKE
ncbi:MULTISPECIES: CvpA family protein [unclassified Desulfurobacterium]|uniref:CvpA family protein n=1 Tax=Desulfurobacterium sp. TC5-1 TaxID=1158318 RepID=UPI0003B438B1|nr:CvpA family protein [Desulfurobacterium sp. TC5-1]